MPLSPVDFKIGDREFQHTPWPAFAAVTEWGDVAAEFGEDALAMFVAGDFAQIFAGLADESAGASAVLKALMSYLTAEDLGERVSHYLTLSKVHVRVESDWLPLFGDVADDTAATAGIDGWDLLHVAWYVVREGFGPLFARLLSSVQTMQQANEPSESSSSSADPA